MKLETERLNIAPFTLDLINAASEKDISKIEALGFIVNAQWPENDLHEALPFFKDLLIKNGINGFNSWIITKKNGNEIVGSIGFIGNPDENGNTEIGFGIIPDKRRRGYCLESATAMIKWTFSQKNVSCIKAQCEEGNLASKSAMEKIGFLKKECKNGIIDWEIRKQQKSDNFNYI